MIVYRLQVFQGEEFANDWLPTMDDAKRALREVAPKWDARVDQLDVPSGREALCAFLKLADASHMNLEGTPIARAERGVIHSYPRT